MSSGLASLTLPATRVTPAVRLSGRRYPASKTAVNMLTVQYAKAFPALRINAVEPGFTKTDLNGNTGFQTVEQGARSSSVWPWPAPVAPPVGSSQPNGTLPW